MANINWSHDNKDEGIIMEFDNFYLYLITSQQPEQQSSISQETKFEQLYFTFLMVS